MQLNIAQKNSAFGKKKSVAKQSLATHAVQFTSTLPAIIVAMWLAAFNMSSSCYANTSSFSSSLPSPTLILAFLFLHSLSGVLPLVAKLLYVFLNEPFVYFTISIIFFLFFFPFHILLFSASVLVVVLETLTRHVSSCCRVVKLPAIIFVRSCVN